MNIRVPSTSDITIDGSEGEGGGQILRSSLALSMITGRPLRLVNIRAGRKKPGLMQQHLTCVNAAAEVSRAEVEGARTGSQEILFIPGPVQPSSYHFRIGTAGSAMLVLQTVLPALFTVAESSRLSVEGGTHNRQAPPFDFFRNSWLPLMEQLGPQFHADLERFGFFPAGGGRVRVQVSPSDRLQGFELLESGRVLDRRVRAVVSRLPVSIAERQVARVIRKLNWPSAAGVVEEVDSSGPGNVLLTELYCEHVTVVFSGFGERGVRAEQVADGVVRSVRQWMKQRAPVGPWLADQLMLPLALSAARPADGTARGGRFRTVPLTLHSETQLALLPRFLDVRTTRQEGPTGTIVDISPRDSADSAAPGSPPLQIQ